jgi:alpha-L-arabinofuranosidase
MISRHYLPLLVKSVIQHPDGALDVSAKRSEDGKALTLQVVNAGDQPTTAAIRLIGFVPSGPRAKVEELSGSLDARNTAAVPEQIKPLSKDWRHGFAAGAARYTFPARSFTVLTFN